MIEQKTVQQVAKEYFGDLSPAEAANLANLADGEMSVVRLAALIDWVANRLEFEGLAINKAPPIAGAMIAIAEFEAVAS